MTAKKGDNTTTSRGLFGNGVHSHTIGTKVSAQENGLSNSHSKKALTKPYTLHNLLPGPQKWALSSWHISRKNAESLWRVIQQMPSSFGILLQS